tara:strand:+ start:45 stop:551 length:507 start_codon:yes stop_codon:yes gene_type:complete
MDLKNKLIYRYSIKNDIKDIKSYLIDDCLNQRHKMDKSKGLNYPIDSIYTNFLYNIFYQASKKYLNNFSLLDVDFKLWCCLTDEKYNDSRWHNHISTSSINCVIYLKTQNKGIFFKNKDEKIHILPEEDDLLIFPSFLNHIPEVSTTKDPRITLNLELRCKEEVNNIF